MSDYWREAVEISLSEHGIDVTEEQIKAIAGDMEASHENYGMAHGYDVAALNTTAEPSEDPTAPLLARTEELKEALGHAIKIIKEHVPEDALGIGGGICPEPGMPDQTWPIRDEYLHNMQQAFDGEPVAMPSDGEEFTLPTPKEYTLPYHDAALARIAELEGALKHIEAIDRNAHPLPGDLPGDRDSQKVQVATITARKALASTPTDALKRLRKSVLENVRNEIFALCEATENLRPEDPFTNGQRYEAKRIRRTMGEVIRALAEQETK